MKRKRLLFHLSRSDGPIRAADMKAWFGLTHRRIRFTNVAGDSHEAVLEVPEHLADCVLADAVPTGVSVQGPIGNPQVMDAGR